MKNLLPFKKIKYRFDQDNNLFSVRSSSEISYTDILVHVGNLMEEDEFHVGMNGLYDFSQLERLTGDVDIFHSTADAMNNKNIIFTAAKTAILVKEKRGDIFNAFYNYTLMTKPSLIEYRVFSLDELDKLYEFLTITEEFHLNN